MIRTVLPVPPKLIFVNWLPQPAFGYNVVCKVPIQVPMISYRAESHKIIPHYVGSQQKNVLINITNTAYVLVQPVGQASFIFGREKKSTLICQPIISNSARCRQCLPSGRFTFSGRADARPSNLSTSVFLLPKTM